jgi:hypothetical protein
MQTLSDSTGLSSAHIDGMCTVPDQLRSSCTLVTPCRTAANRLQPSSSARLNLSRNASPAPSGVMPRVSGDQVSLQHQQPLQPPLQQAYLSEGGLGGSGYLQAPQQQQLQQPMGSASPPGAAGPSRLSNTSRRASGEVSAASLATTYASVVSNAGGGGQQASLSPRPSGVPAGAGAAAGGSVVPTTSNRSAGGASIPGNGSGGGSNAAPAPTAFAADAAGTVAVPGNQAQQGQQGPGIAPSPSYNPAMARSVCERSGGRSGAQTPAELSASGKQPTIHELIAAMREVHEQEAMLRSSSMRVTPSRSSAATPELQAAASAALLAAAPSSSSEQGSTVSAPGAALGTAGGGGAVPGGQLQGQQVQTATSAPPPGNSAPAPQPSSGPLAKLSAVGSMVQHEFSALLDRAMSGNSYHS